jgi:polyisoprenoid-binding protein YceI
MKKLNILAILVFIAGSAFAQTWTLDKAHSNIGFTITHLGVSKVHGQFKTFDATLTATKDDLSDAVFTATADIKSVDTDNEMRNGHLQGEGWFDATKFPTLSFKSTSFTKVSGNKYKLVGDLTMHGVTKPVTLELELNGPVVHPMNKKPLVGLTFTGTLNRATFGVGKTGDVPVSEDLTLHGSAEFGKQ